MIGLDIENNVQKTNKQKYLDEKDLKVKGSVLRRIGSWLKNLMFPRHIKCIFCGDELNSTDLCDTCSNCSCDLPRLSHCCLRCGGPVEENNDGICFNCKANNFSFNSARSVFKYEDKIVGLIHKYKFGRAKYLYQAMAEYMCEVLSKWNISVDIVTFVPLHKNREKARGYNQSKLLAEYIADRFNLELVDAVEKVIDNTAQATLDLKARRENVKNVYKSISEAKSKIKGKNVLLIDDIYTTGSTCNAISEIIKSMHAKDIFVLTFAHSVGDKDKARD